VVIAAPTRTGGGDRSQARYEEIRRCALTGAPLGGRDGVVVLVREGLAAWLARRSVSTDVVETGSPPDRHLGAVPVTDELQTGLVRVLASMALGGHVQRLEQERNA